MGHRKTRKKTTRGTNKPISQPIKNKASLEKPSIWTRKIFVTQGLVEILDDNELQRVLFWLMSSNEPWATLMGETTPVDDIIIKIAGKDYLTKRRNSVKASTIITITAVLVMAILIALDPSFAILKKLINNTAPPLFYTILGLTIIGGAIKSFALGFLLFKKWLIEPKQISILRTLNSIVDSYIIALVLMLAVEISGGRLYISYFVEQYTIPFIKQTWPSVKDYISENTISIILKIMDWVMAGIVGHYSVKLLEKVLPAKVKK
jgi:hypothetical protein